MSCSTHTRRHSAGCEDCKKQARDYARQRCAAIAAGTWQRPVPVAEARSHIRKLKRRRMTNADIAAAARIGVSTVGHILSPKRGRKQVSPDIAQAILAIPLPVHPDRAPRRDWVPTVTASRMVKALCVDGWSISEQSRESGVVHTQIRLLTSDTPPEWINRKTHDRIVELYRRRAGVTNPHPHTGPTVRRRASARGWYPWHAWDDDTIADPRAVPRLDAESPHRTDIEPANVHAAVAGGASYDELTHAELLEVVTTLLAWGWTHARIGAHLRWGETPDKHLDNAAKFCNRNGLTVTTARRGAPATAPTADTAGDEQPELELAA